MSEQETTTTCARHPKVATNLRCATCGTPICPKCLVTTPVGMKCRTCASGASGPLFRPSLLQASLAALVGLVAGVVAGWAVEFDIGFFSLFLAFVYGAFAGEMILRASGRKRGVKMELITGIAMVAGSLGGRVMMAAIVVRSPGSVHPPLGVWEMIVSLVAPSPIPLIALVIVIASAVSRIRYI